MHIIRCKSTPSTNQLLKSMAHKVKFKEGMVIAAEEQTAGRGQSGNSWESEPDMNITCSMLLYPVFLPANQIFLLSEAVSLGIKDALSFYVKDIEIKWPNDIYYQESKLAGILIENELSSNAVTRSIVGVGLNVNQETFVSDAPNPISLKQITGKILNKIWLLDEITGCIWFWYKELKAGKAEAVVQAYHDALYRKSGLHTYEDKHGRFQARLNHVSNDGTLHLITDNGEKRSYIFKEVKTIGE